MDAAFYRWEMDKLSLPPWRPEQAAQQKRLLGRLASAERTRSGYIVSRNRPMALRPYNEFSMARSLSGQACLVWGSRRKGRPLHCRKPRPPRFRCSLGGSPGYAHDHGWRRLALPERADLAREPPRRQLPASVVLRIGCRGQKQLVTEPYLKALPFLAKRKRIARNCHVMHAHNFPHILACSNFHVFGYPPTGNSVFARPRSCARGNSRYPDRGIGEVPRCRRNGSV